MPNNPDPTKLEIPKVVIPKGPLTKEQIKDLREKQAYLLKMRRENMIYHFNKADVIQGSDTIYPNPEQCQLLEEWKNQNWNVFAVVGSNQRGKTTVAVVIAFSYLFGEWPWSGEKIKFSHDEPRQVYYVGQQWLAHIQRTVEPELMKWWPRHRGAINAITRKNNEGIRAYWQDPITKSELYVCSNWQDTITFEGFKADLMIWDEPPKRENRVAAGRGLMARNGRELFVATVINQPWMQREVVKCRREDGTIDNRILVIKNDIWVNVSRCRCGEFIQRTEREKGITFGICAKCGKVADFDRRGLTLEGVEAYKGKLKKSEIAYRIDGRDDIDEILVLPNFDRAKHGAAKRHDIPLDGIVEIEIDFHPSKPWAVLFCYTDKHNFKWFFDFIHKNGSPKWVAEEIVRRCQTGHYRVEMIEIDPLAKGDQNAHEDIQTVYTIMEGIFSASNLPFQVASKDKENGVKLLNDLVMTENEIPQLYIFSDMDMVIQQLEDWVKDVETGLPSKDRGSPDEFCELAYRFALRDTQWSEPLDNVDTSHDNEAYDPLGRREVRAA